jgi:hypothetical protein
VQRQRRAEQVGDGVAAKLCVRACARGINSQATPTERGRWLGRRTTDGWTDRLTIIIIIIITITTTTTTTTTTFIIIIIIIIIIITMSDDYGWLAGWLTWPSSRSRSSIARSSGGGGCGAAPTP